MSQMQFHLPDIKNHNTAKEFFAAFFELNKAMNGRFSYRVFSFSIKWPSSYLSDLIYGRKGLSLQRAIQFADFFKIKEDEAIRLVWFVLLESPHPIVKQFAEKKLIAS